jgi:serine/threonine protein kinase
MYNDRMPEWTGHIIGKVRIEKYLARGGMAEVYLGTHLTLERQVAVKVLHSHIESEPELLARFQREAKVIASLRHANIVQIFDFDTYEGHPYIVMEYVNGLSFSAYLRNLHEKQLKLSSQQIAHLLKSLASGLDYAHSQGVVHRDIKPANILLHSSKGDFLVDKEITQHTEPIITDFGLVRIAHSDSQTASGLVSGTPAYMSPEQARGDKVDHRTDIYSLGIMLYELIAGRVPFEADSTLAVIFKHINEPPPLISDIPPQLQDVINKALAKNPDDRYQSARELTRAYYDAIGLQAGAETVYTRQTTLKPATVSRKPNQSRVPILIGAAVFACACVGVLALGVMGISAASFLPKLQNAQPTAAMQMSNATPDSSYGAPNIPQTGDAVSVGTLRFQNGTAQMDQVTISATLDLPPENKQYEAWLVDDTKELTRSIGVLVENDSGQFTLSYIDTQSGNLLGEFNRLEITLEPNPDDSPNASRNVAYSASLPDASLHHIRHLMSGTDETPGQIPVAVGLINTTTLIQQSTNAMVEASTSGDKAAMKASAEAIVNLIVGKEDTQYYSDLDGNGTINDPGDGFGLLVNGTQAGYLDDMIHHASYSAKEKVATEFIKMHAGHVEICIANLETWVPELRDIALRVAHASDGQDIEADLKRASVLANQMLDGIDINGNEAVDPIEGEGGAKTAFEHAEYMSDMQIYPGENQTP